MYVLDSRCTNLRLPEFIFPQWKTNLWATYQRRTAFTLKHKWLTDPFKRPTSCSPQMWFSVRAWNTKRSLVDQSGFKMDSIRCSCAISCLCILFPIFRAVEYRTAESMFFVCKTRKQISIFALLVSSSQSQWFFNRFLDKPKLRSVVSKTCKLFHVLVYDIKHTSYTPLMIFKEHVIWISKNSLFSSFYLNNCYGSTKRS